jgi:aldehyde:ferredoxin oxidoreductase
MSLIAGIMTDQGRAAARSGLGAVMGSKNLKAIVVNGNMKVPVYDETKATELRMTYLTKFAGISEGHKRYGTPGMTTIFAKTGDLPVKNWAGACDPDFPTVEKLSGDHVNALKEKRYACYRCPIACGAHMKKSTGRYQYENAHLPEYEVMGLFGSNCLNDDLESIIKANDICNENGMDAISAMNVVAFAIDCFENGVITEKDTDGLELTWDNHRPRSPCWKRWQPARGSATSWLMA